MRFQCPICKGIVSVDNSDMGSSVQCGHCNKPVTVPSSRTGSGCVIGDFIILHELGRGGMGVVYLAHQISLDRPAAVKILSENYAKNAEFVVGFIKEARAAAKLNHPNIVQAYAVGDDDGIFYFAMEHVNGETMNNILKRETKLSVDQSIDIIRQIAEALDYAWQEEKLVHRDIKPDNIMLTSTGRAKLADLGLAKVGNENSKAEGDEVMGTPQYISPEQLTGDTLDNRTDIYCLGATFYHFLTGRFPYFPKEDATTAEIARQHLEGTLVPPHQVDPNIPEAVSQVVVKMMEKDPAKRYQSAGKLAEDLAMIKRGQNPGGVSLRVPNAGSPKIQTPKLHVPGKGTPQSNGAPKLSVPGGRSAAGAPALKKPTLTPAAETAQADSPAQGGNKPAPKLVKRENPPVPPPQEVQPAPTPKGKAAKKKKDKEGRSPVVKIIVGIVVVLLLAAAGTVCYLRFVKKQDPVALISQAQEVIRQKTAEPEPSEFMKAADPVIKKIRNQENPNPAENAVACYGFLKKRFAPENEEEGELLREIIAYFARQDENAVEEARIAAITSYEAEQERKRLAAEAAAKEKMEADRRARVQAAERALAEAEKRKLDNERKVLQAKKNAFKRKFEALERNMILELVRCGDKHDAEALKKVFEDNINIRTSVTLPDFITPSELNSYTAPLISKARVLQKTMTAAWEWEKIFTEGDPKLKELPIELKSNLYNLSEIKDGVIHAKTGSKTISVPVADLLNDRKFRLFAVRAASILNKKDTLPFYLFWRGAYKSAHEASLDSSPGGRAAYSRFVTEYLKVAKQDAKARALLPRKFRGVPEFDGKPAPKKPAAKKPAPKKPVPKKPAPKKNAAKKPATKKK